MNTFVEDDIKTLVKLGLNGSQAKIYLTLVSLNASNAKILAQTAGIDRGETYRQLENLQKRGLVAKNIGAPTEYMPMNLIEAIATLIEQRSKKDAELQPKIAALLKKGPTGEETAQKDSQFSFLPSREFGGSYILKLFRSVIRKELIWYTPISRIPLNIASPVASEIWSRPYKWRVIAELDEPTKKIATFVKNYQVKNPNFDIRFVNPNLRLTFVIWDGGEGMNFFTEKEKGPPIGAPILTTTNPQLINLVKDYFELRWSNAMKEFPKEEN